MTEAEYDADARGLRSRLYQSPDAPREAPVITDPKRAAGGWMQRLGAPHGLPPWLTERDLDYVIGLYEGSGFRGGVNYYRNFDRNWELTERWADATIDVPTMFIPGTADQVIGGADAGRLREMMAATVPDLRKVVLFDGVGHWVQQEAPQPTTDALLGFLSTA